MTRYISLVNWTDQGVRNVRQTLDRATAAENLAEKLGARMTDIFWTVGQHDLVAIMEAPDEQTATAVMLALAEGGNIRTSTLRAFRRNEMAEIVQRLP